MSGLPSFVNVTCESCAKSEPKKYVEEPRIGAPVRP
jgi:hypothetical protein